MIVKEANLIGLEVNKSKCEILGNTSNVKFPDEFKIIPLNKYSPLNKESLDPLIQEKVDTLIKLTSNLTSAYSFSYFTPLVLYTTFKVHTSDSSL